VQTSDPTAEFLHHSEHLQSSTKPSPVVASSDRMMWAGGPPAEIVAGLQHLLDYRTSTTGVRISLSMAVGLRGSAQPEIRHPVRDMPGWRTGPSSFQLCSSPPATGRRRPDVRAHHRMTRRHRRRVRSISARISRTLRSALPARWNPPSCLIEAVRLEPIVAFIRIPPRTTRSRGLSQ